MPVLILARHAQAEDDGPSDAERSLTAKGLAQAVEAGAEIAERWSPDVAIASAARRTVQTGQAVVEAVNAHHGTSAEEGVRLQQDESLYRGGVEDWLDAIRSVPPEARCAYIVGHQPAVTEVIAHLCPEAGVPESFRPSTIAVFELEGWDVEPGHYPQPQLRYFHGV